MQIVTTFLVIFSLILFVGCKKPSVKTVLPENNSFEEKSHQWIIEGGVICSTDAKSGKYSLFIKNDSITWSYGEQYIRIPESAKTVTVSGWLKTENVAPGKESYERALLNFEFVDSSFNHLDPYPVAAAELTGTTPWTHYSSSYEVLEQAYAIKLHCALGNTTGKVWFDDLEVAFYSADSTGLSSSFIPKKNVFLNR